MKLPTFLAARAALQVELKAQGWQLSPSLNPQGRPYKIPYATSPSGQVRLWFKPQAVYYTVAPRDSHSFDSARSLWYGLDIRQEPPAVFASTIERAVLQRG